MKRRTVWIALACLAFLACNGESSPSDAGPDGTADGGDGGRYPDPAFVYEASGQVDSVLDEPFQMERPRLYRSAEDLPDTDVRCIQEVSTRVLAGSASGLLEWDRQSDRFVRLALPGGDEAVLDMAGRATADGKLALITPTRLVLLDLEGTDHLTVSIDSALSVAASRTQIYAGTEQGPLELVGDALQAVTDAPALPVRDLLVSDDGDLYLATGSGVWQLADGSWQQHTAADSELLDDDVQSLAWMEVPPGVLAGSAQGVTALTDQESVAFPAGLGGLPRGACRALAYDHGWILVGHDVGASYFDTVFPVSASMNHYHSLRWLPADEVRGVDMLHGARLWIATSGGIARISFEPQTLAGRADLFESMNDGFWRLDFVSCGGLRSDPWDLPEPLQHHDHDNDGLWTQMQVGAWCYAAGATGDQTYCEKARRAMRGMQWLIDIPAVSFEAQGDPRGFVSRSFVRDDEGDVYESKVPQDNWHLVEGWEDGHDYRWKDDTSSDETTGHFFGYPLYYDFCARDQAERAALADHIAALARHIVDHGFRLIDLDGERTLHGHWDPDTLAIALDGVGPCTQNHSLEDCMSAAYGGGWLNAIEILGHMLAAYHMTGDPTFYDAYSSLVEDHRYAELVDFHDEIYTVTTPAIANHSDHELAMLGYHTLIRYEPDDARRARWIQSLLAMYEYEKPERNPCWAAFVAGVTPEGYELADAIRTMREWPEDWREWRVDNSHRMDVERDVDDRHGHEQIKTVLPYDEIRTMKWNGNPYALADGGDGREVQAPWPWLLPYWIFRYHGVIL
ncbi:MAG: hypothetical protein JXR96_12940 [Deltaproteobacteria bacterium]|nr:hypothetical protein [Deltaproteobacteria bacterium]